MKFVVGGQMDKKLISGLLVKLAGDAAEVTVATDIEATLALKNGQADYYFGCCATGAGGALGITMGLLGKDKCLTVSMPGRILTQEEISKAVEEGKAAFGFVNYDAERVLPMLVTAIRQKAGL